jgi:hypothetical protein
MSVDRIWCFDLAFLREFVRTGKIPQPKPATREVVYRYQLLSTLDQFSDILKTANGRGVQVLQVSEGYKLSLGGILIEVLYPPQSFYDALHNPVALKRMLNRKLPEDWDNEREEGERGNARILSMHDGEARLAETVERPEMPEEGVHLSDLPEEFHDEQLEAPDDQGKNEEVEPEILPWRMVGTLYNNLSIVVKMTVLGGITSPSILFPGDLSDWTTLVLRQWPNLRADILKMPHHGSKNVTFDLNAVIEAMDHPYPWYWFFKRGFPFWYPFSAPLSRQERRRFYDAVRRGDPLSVIRDIVGPAHLLVFPHPQHRLPSLPLGDFRSNAIANRMKRDPQALNLKNNEPIAARILVGLERRDVAES